MSSGVLWFGSDIARKLYRAPAFFFGDVDDNMCITQLCAPPFVFFYSVVQCAVFSLSDVQMCTCAYFTRSLPAHIWGICVHVSCVATRGVSRTRSLKNKSHGATASPNMSLIVR